MLVVNHGGVGVAEFFHYRAFINIGTGEFLAVLGMGVIVSQGAVDVSVGCGGDADTIAGLCEEQVAIGAVMFGDETVGRQGFE